MGAAVAPNNRTMKAARPPNTYTALPELYQLLLTSAPTTAAPKSKFFADKAISASKPDPSTPIAQTEIVMKI